LNNVVPLNKWNDTSFYSNLAFLEYGIKERHHKRVIEDIVLKPFEDSYFCVMKGYEEALTDKYGDYMQLPPEKDRICKHDFNKHFWK